MEGEGVILAPDRSQTTLRQIGGGVVYPLAGHDRHGAPDLGSGQSAGQARGSAADDENVALMLRHEPTP